MNRLAPTCSNCGASDFVWANDLKTGGIGGGSLSLRSRGELSLGTRICRSCGHADLFLKDPSILRQPHTWKPGEFTPITSKPANGPAPHSGPASTAPSATPPPPPPTLIRLRRHRRRPPRPRRRPPRRRGSLPPIPRHRLSCRTIRAPRLPLRRHRRRRRRPPLRQRTLAPWRNRSRNPGGGGAPSPRAETRRRPAPRNPSLHGPDRLVDRGGAFKYFFK